MDILTQALTTRLPFVHVSTDDIIHVGEVLSFIAGEEVSPLDTQTLDSAGWPEGEVFYTNEEQPSPKLYLKCQQAGKCLVFVNTKASVLHFNGGVMFPPKDLMRAFLLSLDCPEDKVDSLMPAYGGLTLKDMYEVTMLTINRTGGLSTRAINATRQSYITKLKGITQIDTNYSFYQCPKQLQDWVNANLPFFKKDYAKELVPRGLLFDGTPGTGKTMGAKYLAQTLGVPLYHLDIAGMKAKYVGESEGNLQAALAQIDQVEPCIPSVVVLQLTIGNLTIGELYDRQHEEQFYLKGVHPETLEPCVMKLHKVIKREDKRTLLKITTETGTIRVTENHKLLCTRNGINEWVEAQYLQTGDILVEV